MALTHFIEMQFNRLEEKFHQSHAVSEALVKEMASLAKKHDIKFVLVGISKEHETLAMLHFAQENGIPNVDIAVDDWIKEHTNRPHDKHPSAMANKKYAERLQTYLKAEILK